MNSVDLIMHEESRVYDLGSVAPELDGMNLFVEFDSIFLVNFKTDYYLELDKHIIEKIKNGSNIMVDGINWPENLREAIKGILPEHHATYI